MSSCYTHALGREVAGQRHFWHFPPTQKVTIGHILNLISGNSKAQNERERSAARKLKMTKSQQRELHNIITGQGFSYQEILEIACDIVGVYME